MGYEILSFYMGFCLAILLFMAWIAYKLYEIVRGLVEEFKKEING